MKHFKYILLLLPLLYYSCNDDILQDLDSVAAQNEEQDARIDSLLTVITAQQEYIDSMNNVQNAYIDSLISESSFNDSLLQVYTDSLYTVQNTLNADQQAYIDSLNGVQQTLINALISTSPSTGENYIRINSLQISWGDTTYSSQQSVPITVTLPFPFISTPSVLVTSEDGNIYVESSTINSIILRSTTYNNIYYCCYWVNWVAIGQWQ